MEIADVITAISTVGFPIVACCAMFWLMNRNNETIKDLTVTLAEMRQGMESIKDELMRLSEEVHGHAKGD